METKTGLVFKLGLGLWKGKHKNIPLCKYGGVQVTSNYAEKYLLPFEDKCDYVIKICETTNDGTKHICLNSHPTGSETYGQLLNHSSLHFNAITKIYATGKNRLDVIFVAKHDIRVDEKIVSDYGKNYTGVNPCVTSCFKCKNVNK